MRWIYLVIIAVLIAPFPARAQEIAPPAPFRFGMSVAEATAVMSGTWRQEQSPWSSTPIHMAPSQ